MDVPRVWLLEANGDGHRLLYAAAVATALLRAGAEVVLTGPPTAMTDTHPLFTEYVLPVASDGMSVSTGEWDRSSRRRTLVNLGRSLRAGDVLVVLDGDLWAPALASMGKGAFRDASVLVVVTRPVAQGADPRAVGSNAVKKILMRIALRRVPIRVGILEIPGRDIRPGWGPSAEVVADPLLNRPSVQTQAQARAAFGLSADVLVVGLLGPIDARKNPTTVAGSCELLATRGHDVVLLAPGPWQHAGLRAAVKSLLGRATLVTMGRYLTSREFGSALRACDVVALVYSNEGSSGLVNEAAAAGVPVVAAGSRSLAANVSSRGIGMVVSNDEGAVADGIEAIVARGSGVICPAAGGGGTKTVVEWVVERTVGGVAG